MQPKVVDNHGSSTCYYIEKPQFTTYKNMGQFFKGNTKKLSLFKTPKLSDPLGREVNQHQKATNCFNRWHSIAKRCILFC